MKRVEIAENHQAEVRLTPEQGHALAASDIVTAVPSPRDPQRFAALRTALAGITAPVRGGVLPAAGQRQRRDRCH